MDATVSTAETSAGEGRRESIDGALDRWLETRRRTGEITDRSLRSLEGRTRQLREAVGKRCLEDVDSDTMDDWLASIAHLSPATRRHYFTTARMFFDWAVLEGLCGANPLRERRPPREPRRLPRALPAPAVDAILARCPDERARVIVVLMVQLGLRRGEVARLAVEDFDLFTNTVHIVGKGGHERVLPLTRQALHEVRTYLEETEARHGPFLRSRVDPLRGLGPEMVSQIVKQAMCDAGVKRRGHDRVTPHALRHTMATELIRGGAHLLDVQQALGHSSVTVTQTYLPLVVDGLAETMEGRWYGAGQPPYASR